MKSNLEEYPEAAKQTAGAVPVEKEKGERPEDRETGENGVEENGIEGNDGKRSSPASALVFAVAAFGWEVVKGLLRKTSAPEKKAAPVRAPEKHGRAADRNLESEAEVATDEKWGTLFVFCAFAIAVAAGVAFLFTYWLGGSNLLLGVTLGLTFLGFGMALVFCARWLMRHKEATEPRETLPSNPEEREAALKAYCTGMHDVQRRGMLRWMGLAGGGLLTAMVVSLMRSLGGSPDDALYTTVWKPGQRLMSVGGKPITLDSLRPGSSITVFPEDSRGSEKTQTVLVRVQEQLLQLPTERADWAPMGYLAYSRICTHAGCPVGIYEADTHLLLCPCHQSTFDVLRGALPMSGPAARPLPQLPLYVDSDGTLRAAAGFSTPPGPGFWGMPS